MLTTNFAAALNASEPLEILQDTALDAAADLGAQGNAFAGSRANADHEMYNAIHGAIMNGDTGGNSSIANAGMRLAAKFGSVASKSEKDAEKNRAAYIQVMSQQLQNMRNDMEAALNGMRERQGELEEQLDSLTRLRNLVNEGEFDPANADHLALYNSAFGNDPEMSATDFVLQTQSRQNDLIDGTESEVEAERVELEHDIEEAEATWREIRDMDPEAQEPENIEALRAIVEQQTSNINARWELGEDNPDEVEASAHTAIASNFTFG